jgi:ankyrin repeat protein
VGIRNLLKVSISNIMTAYDELEKMCVSHLNSMDIAEYEARLARPIEGTLEWVRDNPEYIAWMSSKDANLLWVTGYAGCGKTTMAAYIVQCLSKYPQPNAIVCRFFCDNKNEEHQNATILLRSLIFQIVDRRKKLVKLVRKASDSGGMQIFDRFDALWNLFVRLVQAERTFRISVVIDAIDECDESTQKRILDRISELLALGDSTSVKFFITSRPDTPTILAMSLSSTRLVRLALEQRQDKISHDVNLVIHHRVNNIIERGGCKPSTGQKIADLLIAKADKTFLWVSLVLPQLEARRVLESPDIFSSIERLGTGVALIYTQFLSSIPEEDQALAARMLRLLVVSAETLTSDEFGIFLAIDHKYKSTTFRHDSILFDAKTAQAALGPLVRVSDSKIELAHLTLKEYLLELSNRPNDPLSKIFGVDLLRDTVTLATACISYLLLDEFQGDIFSGNSPTMSSPISMAKEMLYENEDGDSLFAFDLFDDPMFEDVSTLSKSRVEMLRSHYGLFHHAAVHWATYYTRCEDAVTTEQEQDAIALYETQRSANWFRYYWYERHSWDSYPSNINPLMISAYFGHTRMLQRFLSEKDYEDRQIVGRALYWAARQGHAGCVESILLYHEDIGDYYDCTIGESPLGTAAQYGNQQCLFEILRFDRVDVNLQNAHGRTPISLAAVNDHEDVVTTLLSREDILVDLPDKAQSTPFLWAVSAGSIRVVSHFLSDKRVNKEHTDISGRNALSYAAGDGTIEMVENLLKSGMINPGSQDIHGRTPLSYAAQYGQYDIVRALVKSGRSNISARDKDGRIALSWAARQGDSRVLHYLLKREVSCARIPDANGWLPLAWALDPPGYPDNIRILLQSMTAEEVNRKDDVHGRTTLSWTAAYGYLEITRHLVSFNGIDLEAGDNNGRTPLSYAAGNGNVEVAKALIQTERVQVDSRDENGRTPLSWAAAEGQCPMVEFLLTCPGVDALSTDNIGRTPVDYASLHGYDTVVQVLEEHANRNVS